MTAAWVCDSCETNNLPGAATCRNCHRAPGSARGVPEQVSFTSPEEPEPTFVESKHAEPPRITLTPPPPPPPRPVRPAPPPRSPFAPPPRPPRPSRAMPGTGKVVLGTAGVILGMIVVSRAMNSHDSTSPAATPPVCPAVVARWLPGGAATLVVQYRTDKHVVTLCRDGSGRLYYDGQVRGAPADSENHISLAATETPSGYVARNGPYVYEIVGSQLTVTNQGRPVSRMPLTQVAP